MDKEKAKNILETLLFVTNRPLPMEELCDTVGEDEPVIKELIEELKADLAARKSSLQIAEVGEGYQFATHEGYSYWVKKLFREQLTFRLSPSAMETLSIIAYKQPITRAEIEEIRGVEVTGVLDTLVERKLAKIAGRKEAVGRPLLYSTTPEFLRHFHLWRISELPSLEDLSKELERKQKEAEASGQFYPDDVASEKLTADQSEQESVPVEPSGEAVTETMESAPVEPAEKQGEGNA